LFSNVTLKSGIAELATFAFWYIRGMADDAEETALIIPTEKLPISLNGFLTTVRPEWQHRSLIERVKKLLDVDPSSACQRLLNAAFHDLRQKIVIAGIDLAQQAATANKLPPISKPEDVLESYSNSHIIDLAYRIGILSRTVFQTFRKTWF